MPRTARIVVPGVAHHVTQRGNNRQDVFFTDEKMIERLRSGIARGRPLGSDRFLAKLEAMLNRRLRALPCGRPRKAKKG